MTAQRGDFDSPTASSFTDRRDADDAVWQAELARLDGLVVADPWRDQIIDALRPHRYDSVGMMCDCGFETGLVCDGLTREEHLADVLAALKPAPGTERDHEARARDVLLPEVFAAERDRFAAPGTGAKGICQAFTGCVNALDQHNSRCPAAPGTDTPDQAVQRVLALAEELDLLASVKGAHPMAGYDEGYREGLSDGEAYAADRIRRAVAPQRDHDEEGGR